MNRVLLFLLFFACAFCTALAQQADIHGTVSDSTTGERIPYANIMILGLSKGSAANTAGYYRIPSLPLGAYDIQASAVGFEKRTVRVVVLDDKTVTVNFLLPPSTVRLSEVVVTESMKPELLSTQTSVHVIDKAELKQVPVGPQADILKSIQILPGFVTTSDVNAQFYVRGGAGDQNLFLLDGMRIYNPFHAFGLFSTFDPDIVRTTEVYTGAFPADFGGRLSAVVNMISRDGNASRFSSTLNVNFLSSKLQLEGPVGNSVQAIFTGRKSLFSRTFKTYLKQDVPLSFYDAFAKLSIKDPSSQDRYSIQALVTDDQLSASSSSDAAYSWSTKAVGVEGNFLMSDRLFWNLTLSLSDYEARRIVREFSSAPPGRSTISEFGLRANITSYTDSKDIYFFGFELDFPKAEYQFVDRLGTQVRLAETLLQFSLWMRYQMNLEGLNADLGLRAEIGNFFRWGDVESALEPRASVSIPLTARWKAKASYGRFSQGLITVSNEDDVLPIFTPWIVIPTSLKPQTSNHYVLGVEGPVTTSLSVTLQAFYKQYPTLVAYNRDKIEVKEPDYINAEGSSYGGEILLRYSVPLMDFFASYTLARVVLKQPGFEYPPRYDRRHTANLLQVLHPLTGLDISLRWEFGSGLPFTRLVGFYEKLNLGEGYPNSYVDETGQAIPIYGLKNGARLPTYHRLDVNFNYTLIRLPGLEATVGAGVTNVYDRKNIFYFDRTTGRRTNMLRFFPTAAFSLEFRP